MGRNGTVYGFQNNRNPFIDHPEFAELVWGDVTGVEGGGPVQLSLGQNAPKGTDGGILRESVVPQG